MDQVLLIVTGAVLAFAGAAATLLVGEIQAKRRRAETLEDTQLAWERQRQHERDVWLRDKRLAAYATYRRVGWTFYLAQAPNTPATPSGHRTLKNLIDDLLHAQTEVFLLAEFQVQKAVADRLERCHEVEVAYAAALSGRDQSQGLVRVALSERMSNGFASVGQIMRQSIDGTLEHG